MFDELIYCIALLYGAYQLYHYFSPPSTIPAAGNAVLITGADTGFGSMISRRLAKLGYTVIATCLTEKSAQEFQKELGDKHLAIKLDVTKSEDIEGAVGKVKEKTGGKLYALINNAGIGLSGLVDLVPMEQYRKTMEVNFFGLVAMTKTFLPLLMAHEDDSGRGRVICVASVAGFLGAPNLSSYCASKHAVEGFCDSLRREMKSWKVHVSTLEPGYMATNILDTLAKSGEIQQKLWEDAPKDARERWGEDFNRAIKKKYDILLNLAENPKKVIDAMEHAVTSSAPRSRYRVGNVSKFLLFPSCTFLPDWLTDFAIYHVDWVKTKPAGAVGNPLKEWH